MVVTFRATCLLLAAGFAWVIVGDLLRGGPLLLRVAAITPLRWGGLTGCTRAFASAGAGVGPLATTRKPSSPSRTGATA